MKKFRRRYVRRRFRYSGSELDDAQEEIGSEMKKITTTASAVITTTIWRKTMDR
jgi:hypothetical protein